MNYKNIYLNMYIYIYYIHLYFLSYVFRCDPAKQSTYNYLRTKI